MELIPRDNGTFRISGLADPDLLREPGACQARLDTVAAILELIDDSDVVLDLSDKATATALEIIYMSAYDHFMICDFEMAVSIGEIVLELDSEGKYDITPVLAYCYAMLADREAVEEMLPFSGLDNMESQLVKALLEFRSGNTDVVLSKELKQLLSDPSSDISERTAHLWIEIPKFKELFNILYE